MTLSDDKRIKSRIHTHNQSDKNVSFYQLKKRIFPQTANLSSAHLSNSNIQDNYLTKQKLVNMLTDN